MSLHTKKSLHTKTHSNLPTLFIHGSFANSKSWKKIIEIMGPDKKTSNPNLPGHGNTPSPDDFESPSFKPEFDRLLNAAHNELGQCDALHLVGHSYGAVVALSLAMEGILPVARLTLFESVDASILSVFDKKEAYDNVMTFEDNYRQAYEKQGDGVYARVIDYWGGPGSFDTLPEHIRQQMEPLTKENIRHWNLIKGNARPAEQYKNLSIPTTVVVGAKSNMVAKTISKTIQNNLPNCRYLEIENASHFMITSHPEECANILKNHENVK